MNSSVTILGVAARVVPQASNIQVQITTIMVIFIVDLGPVARVLSYEPLAVWSKVT